MRGRRSRKRKPEKREGLTHGLNFGLLSREASLLGFDLVVSRQTNDLRLTIHGSSDQITVQNWNVGANNRIETLQAGNGQVLLNIQVDQLIQAMAWFTAQTGLTWDQGIEQRSQDVQPVLESSWQ